MHPTRHEQITAISLVFLALLHAALTFLFALMRLYGFKASLLDIGLFDQVLWNMQYRGIPETTATLPFTPQHWFGFHFSPILFSLLPLYTCWPYPEMLQAVQSACFAAAGIPLFYAARACGANRAEAWACALLYWFNPLILGAALWDFHEIAFASLFIALAFWALCAKRFSAMLAALFLLLLTKEHYGIAAAGFGFLWGLRHGDWKRGIAVMAAGLAATAIILAVVMPHFHGAAHPMLTGEGNVVSRYSWLAAPWPEKLDTFTKLMLGDGSSQITGLMHLALLLLSGLLFPLAAPLYLAPAAADLLANLLSTNPMPRHNASYHAAACVPIFIVAGLQGYMWITSKQLASPKLLATTALALAAVMPLCGLTFFPFRVWELKLSDAKRDTQAISHIASLLGKGPVAAQANVGMFFSGRQAMYPFPNMLDKTDHVVLHLYQPFANPDQQHFNIPYGMNTRAYMEKLRDFMAESGWHVAYWNAPWLVMERGAATEDESNMRAAIGAAIDALGIPKDRSVIQNP